MKLVRLNKVPPEEREGHNLLVGVRQKVPAYVARWNVNSREWSLYRTDGRNDHGKLVLRRTGNLETKDDVLAFYRGKGLTPFCPKHREGASGPERRRYPRKPVNMNAEYLNHRTKSDGVCVVEDISHGGLRFKTISRDNIEPADKLYVKILTPEGEIQERLSAARHVAEAHVGAEFINKSIIHA